MATKQWEEVIDELYEMGGYAEMEYIHEVSIESDLDLGVRTEIAKGELIAIIQRLESSDLVQKSPAPVVKDSDDGGRGSTLYFWQVGLTEDGFGLAHDRKAERRNHENNQSIIILTFVLAVGSFPGNGSDGSDRFQYSNSSPSWCGCHLRRGIPAALPEGDHHFLAPAGYVTPDGDPDRSAGAPVLPGG